ncbi:MAG: PAS-domain containing protein [Sulfitobacter sp.]|nr:PAS-domain containing protein [Sulfitobacter sp.]
MDDLIVILAVIIPTIVLSVWWVFRSSPKDRNQHFSDPPVILFKNGTLEYASDTALATFPIVIGGHSWTDLYDILRPQYPDFPEQVASNGRGRNVIKGRDNKSTLEIDWRKDGATLTFYSLQNLVTEACDMEELELLRQIDKSLPHPAWKTDDAGTLVWHNEAYRVVSLRAAKTGSDIIFDLPPSVPDENTCRIKFEPAGSTAVEWFDVTCYPVDGGMLHHATSRTALIRAEEAQRDFVQTLAKTFAHLSIGLAIFNRDRQLALFNPALTDLTGLSVSFLSPRPTIDSFFDALRENRRMPEPKNYKTWRQRMADLITDAEVGRFEETWTLESGQTFSVKGRPHPDGAIAFLIEDISAEVSLARNFRAELELGQNLADTFEDALAVFSRSGQLTFSNKAYDHLWGFDSGTGVQDTTITDAVRLWQEKSLPNPLWQDLKDAVMTLQDRSEWTMPVCLKGQSPMLCKIVPIAAGATVVRFSRQSSPVAQPRARLKKNSD